MIRRPPRSTLFPTRRSSDLVQIRNGTDNTHVFGNVIDQNYVGVGLDDPDTNGNIVENNVATRNANKNIRNLRSEEHTSELQSRQYLVCRLLLEKKNHNNTLL